MLSLQYIINIDNEQDILHSFFHTKSLKFSEYFIPTAKVNSDGPHFKSIVSPSAAGRHCVAQCRSNCWAWIPENGPDGTAHNSCSTARVPNSSWKSLSVPCCGSHSTEQQPVKHCWTQGRSHFLWFGSCAPCFTPPPWKLYCQGCKTRMGFVCFLSSLGRRRLLLPPH